MVHFPEYTHDPSDKDLLRKFLMRANLTKISFKVLIADFGLATCPDSQGLMKSQVGTPLTMAPQTLARK
jgi:serine/threonine protein kinase